MSLLFRNNKPHTRIGLYQFRKYRQSTGPHILGGTNTSNIGNKTALLLGCPVQGGGPGRPGAGRPPAPHVGHWLLATWATEGLAGLLPHQSEPPKWGSRQDLGRRNKPLNREMTFRSQLP